MHKINELLHRVASDKQWATISNVLTLLRILLTPFIAVNLYYQRFTLAFILFFVAALTDLLDGALARLFDQQTQLGTLLDPIADKILLVSSFGTLAFVSSPLLQVPQWFFMLVACRELIIIVGSTVLLLRCKGMMIRPLIWGKATTLLQILLLMWIFVCYFASWQPRKTFDVMVIVLAFFSLVSLSQYARYALQRILFADRS